MIRGVKCSLLAGILVLVPVSIRAGQDGVVDAEIVDTESVVKAIARGAIVWDARDAAEYAEEHIPGAVNFGAVGGVLRDANREDLLPAAQAEAIFGQAGVDPVHREIVVYTRKGDPSAYYGLLALRYYGARQARVYHGGIEDWKAAGRPVAREATRLPPTTVRLAVREDVALWNREMLDRVRSGGAQIVDARAPAEYAGDDIRAIRGGRIPGALNIPYEQNWTDPQAAAKLARKEARTREGMTLKAGPDLRALYAQLDPGKETVVYCQSGVRASVTAAVLRSIGFKDVKVYEPSWLGYAGMLSAPVEQETFLNVNALAIRIATLENRVKELEAELAVLKGRPAGAPAPAP
jgi:thiosulfate/3-mercaptopyruvate sulfurtransferase